MTDRALMTTHLTTERDLRSFGILVGAVLAVIGAWFIYRGTRSPVPASLLLVGIVLIIAGLVRPRLLATPYRLWMKLAELLAVIMTTLILSVVFFLIVTPIGIVRRLMGADPLRRRAEPADSYWTDYTPRQRNSRHYEKMY